jgi:hypothetical protein
MLQIWGYHWGKPQTSSFRHIAWLTTWRQRGPNLSIYKIATLVILPIMYTRSWAYTLFLHKSELVSKAHYHWLQLPGLSIIKWITTTSTRFY